MKLITKDTDYAIRALCCIVKQNQKVFSVDELVRSLNMPGPFLRKILQILGKQGIVRSFRGKGGGFSLFISPRELSLFDIIKAFQGPVRLMDHTFRKKPCPNLESCNLKRKIDEIEKIVISKLKAATIASIIR